MKHRYLALLVCVLAMPSAFADGACALRQSTASQEVLLGPFFDRTDGVTAETALTIANTDVRVSKAGANIVAKNSGGGTHDELGFYQITLDATDTNTVGTLDLAVDDSAALPVWLKCYVYEEAVFDALYASAATGPVTSADLPTNFGDLDIEVTTGHVDVGYWNGAEITTTLETSADIADAVRGEPCGTETADTLGDLICNDLEGVANGTITVDADVSAISGDTPAANNAESFFDGTGYAGTGNTIPTVTDVTNQVSADVTAISGDGPAADNLESYTDGTTEMPVNAECINNETVLGQGTSVDKWRGDGTNC